MHWNNDNTHQPLWCVRFFVASSSFCLRKITADSFFSYSSTVGKCCFFLFVLSILWRVKPYLSDGFINNSSRIKSNDKQKKKKSHTFSKLLFTFQVYFWAREVFEPFINFCIHAFFILKFAPLYFYKNEKEKNDNNE